MGGTRFFVGGFFAHLKAPASLAIILALLAVWLAAGHVHFFRLTTTSSLATAISSRLFVKMYVGNATIPLAHLQGSVSGLNRQAHQREDLSRHPACADGLCGKGMGKLITSESKSLVDRHGRNRLGGLDEIAKTV